MAVVPVVLIGLEPSTSAPPDETRASPLLVPVCVSRTFPAEALATNGAPPLAVLMAETSPARSVVAVFSATEYGVAPSETVKVSAVTLKSYRAGMLEPRIVDGVPEVGGTAGAYGV